MNEPLIIKFKLLYQDSKPPTRARSGDAGWDLSCHHANSIISGAMVYMTGVAVEIPAGFFGLLRPRSSICNGPHIFNSSGVIDSGFRGEIGVPMNCLRAGKPYKSGDRIAQLIILPLPDVSFVQVNELSESVRGEGGFGSTGA